MGEINPKKAALAFGAFVSLMHLGWVLLVGLKLGQPLLTWIYGLHFLNNPFTVQAFDLVTALTLVGVTFVGGAFFGWLLATLWNKCAGCAAKY